MNILGRNIDKISDEDRIDTQNFSLDTALKEEIDPNDKVSKNLIQDLLGSISNFKDEDQYNTLQGRSLAKMNVSYKD